MSNIHEQALHYIYQQVLDRLLEHMSQAQRASVQLLVQRLLVAAGGVEYIGGFRLLVVQGPDEGSARLLAFLRAAQLSIALRTPATFRLQVVVASRPTPAPDALEQLERTFSALFLQDDPRVELLVPGAHHLQPFTRQAGTVTEDTRFGREALLVFGHLCGGQPEALFGSRLHLEMADALQAALSQATPPDALVTAVPLRQRRRFLGWSRAAARQCGEHGNHVMHQCAAALCETLGRLRARIARPLDSRAANASAHLAKVAVRVIAVDDLVLPAQEGDLLHCVLGVQTAQGQGPLGAAFDHAYLAYLQRLRDRWLPGTGEPGRLLAQPVPDLFQRGFGVDDEQLTCLLFAPFAEQGRRLAAFVQRCHPTMRVALPYLHRALQGQPCPEAVVNWLIGTSGLTLAQLRAIYSGRLAQPHASLMARMARRDVGLRLLAPPLPCADAMARIAS